MSIKYSPGGAPKRIGGNDADAAIAVLQVAMLLVVPEDQTQRQVFATLMPYLYVLRNKGCSWPQLTKILVDCGLNFQPATVRTYYSEMLEARQDLCQERMNEQLMVMAEIRKETQGVDMAAITSKVSTVLKERRLSHTAKVDAVLGLGGGVLAERPAGGGAAGRTPSPVVEAAGLVNKEDSFGLLNLKPVEQKKTASPGFFNLDDEPAEPVVQTQKPVATPDAVLSPVLNQRGNPSDSKPRKSGSRPAPFVEKTATDAPSLEIKPKFVCQPLQPDIEELERRARHPDEIYEDGEMEHPYISGLMLSREQRLYGATLEYMDTESGEILMESSGTCQ